MTPHTPRHTRPFVAAITLCVVAAIVASLTACDRRDDNAATTLELWTLDLTNFKPHIDGLITSFEAQNPGVRVEWVDVPFSALDRKLIAAAAAGRAPDVVNFSDMTFARFASLGATADLAPHLPRETVDAYLPGVLSMMRMDGKLLGLPWYLSTQTLIANTDLLAASGLSPDGLPRDWAGLRALAAHHRDQTGTFLFSLPLGEESVLPWMMLADGIVPFAGDDAGRLTANIDTPEARDFLAAWIEMYRAGLLPR